MITRLSQPRTSRGGVLAQSDTGRGNAAGGISLRWRLDAIRNNIIVWRLTRGHTHRHLKILTREFSDLRFDRHVKYFSPKKYHPKDSKNIIMFQFIYKCKNMWGKHRRVCGFPTPIVSEWCSRYVDPKNRGLSSGIRTIFQICGLSLKNSHIFSTL